LSEQEDPTIARTTSAALQVRIRIGREKKLWGTDRSYRRST